MSKDHNEVSHPDTQSTPAEIDDIDSARELAKARLVALSEIAPIGMFWSHPDGKHDYINPKLATLLGYECNQPIPNWGELIHPDDREIVLNRWQESLSRGQTFKSRHRIVRSDGSQSWVNVVSSPYYEGGSLRGLIGIMLDDTERTMIEEERERLERDREELLRQLQLTLDSSPIGCFLLDPEFKATYWNPSAAHIFGYSADEIVGKCPVDLLTPGERRPWVKSKLNALSSGGGSIDAIAINVTKDGRAISCSWHCSPLIGNDGRFLGAVVMFQDITSRVKAEEALRQSEEMYRQIVSTAREGVWLLDADGRTSFVNNRMADMLGYTPEEMIGQSHFNFMDEEARAEAERRFGQRRDGVSEQHDFCFRQKDGSKVWTIVSASPMYGTDGVFTGVITMVTDITERKQHEEFVRWQAYHDPLTQLPNRALFEDRLGQLLVMARRQGGHVGVLFLDLDRFKHVNDTLGHGMGDRLLQVVAQRLHGCLRAEDTIARMGGDEFTILLPGIEHPESAAKVAQKLLEALAQPVVIDDHELFVGGSIGVSLFPEDGQDTQTLLKHADIAMYRAKDQGGNGYYLFTQSMNMSALEHLIMENSLRKAISRDEFHLVYQPQVDLETGEITAVEALCRWRHPELGIVQPAQFIPLAEETGMIIGIGDWVMNEACRQAAIWCREGLPLRVSINISARQFAQPGLAQSIAAAIERHGVAPEWIDLELTESAIMKNAESAAETLRELRNLGVKLSLDDFGTGYSSLSYLRHFPFDTLKIDRSFVKTIIDDPVDEAVVRAIVDLAHALDLEVVCEGIETDEQCRALQDLGCNVMQGYLFSAPIAPERISVLRPLMRGTKAAA